MKRRSPAHPVITLVDLPGYFILGITEGFLIIYKAVSVFSLTGYSLYPFLSIELPPAIETTECKDPLTPPYLDVSGAIAAMVEHEPRIGAPAVRAGSTRGIVF